MLTRLFHKPAPKPDPAADIAAAGIRAAAGDADGAVTLLLPLAKAGHARAQAEIGCLLMAAEPGSNGLEPDDEAAAKWLIAAAIQADTLGERALAEAYYAGRGVPIDYVAARMFFDRAAAKGDAIAQDRLSEMLAQGINANPDPAGAARWAEAAARQGVVRAMTRLGRFYNDGNGVPRDPERAAHWWRAAALAEDADAQALIGAAYATGRGVPRDPVRAVAWLIRAKAGGGKHAEGYLDGARRDLSAADLASAQMRAFLPLTELDA